MNKRIAVTGATGTIGRALVAQLREAGADLVTVGRHAGLDRQADLHDPQALERAFQGVDTVFLLEALVPDKAAQASNAIAAAQRAGVRQLVRSSGAGADPDSPVAIARLQGQIDAQVQASGLAWTLLRPTSFMQNWLTLQAGQVKAGTVYAPHGQGAVGVVDVRDIAAVATRVLMQPADHVGQVYTLTGPQALSDAQMVATLSQALGREVRYMDVPEAQAEQAMQAAGLPPEVIAWLMSLHHVIKQGWAAGLSDDVQRVTGQAPRSFDAFVREHLQAWR